MSLEDKAIAIHDDPYANAVKDITLDVAKEEMGRFVENSKIMIQVMDEVGKIHPFIQGKSW